ncbi:type II toxin-antitoxin system YafO family toxin [Sodalis sp. RH22]|uniref:type II toxin-antitoxin system YafO family toxin n=1 Tax=unclassified Sodalis (in: enterobacteria) TaxID=2636512 RepID=UPI0039B5287B
MVYVSITDGLRSDQTAQYFASMLAKNLSGLPSSPLFGARGGFERNRASVEAGIEKFHIRMPNTKPWASNISLSRRTSNNYLVFARHFYKDNYYQILALISPNAHQRIDDMLPALIELAEKYFIELSDNELANLQHFTC